MDAPEADDAEQRGFCQYFSGFQNVTVVPEGASDEELRDAIGEDAWIEYRQALGYPTP